MPVGEYVKVIPEWYDLTRETQTAGPSVLNEVTEPTEEVSAVLFRSKSASYVRTPVVGLTVASQNA